MVDYTLHFLSSLHIGRKCPLEMCPRLLLLIESGSHGALPEEVTATFCLLGRSFPGGCAAMLMTVQGNNQVDNPC